jgi:Mn2+/Fe2+ NRAMP family transporter
LLFGVPQWASVLAAAFLLIVITSWGRYSFVERTAIIVGLFELAFLPAVFLAQPDLKAVAHILGSQPWHDRSYWLLIAANVGAVIMPWMIYYQEGAVVDKGLTADSIKLSRWDTIIGSVATQVIMAAVLVLTAATIGRAQPNASLANIEQIADALIPLLGPVGGKILFSLGVTGSALIAAIVVSLATSWTFGVFSVYEPASIVPGEKHRFFTSFTVAELCSLLPSCCWGCRWCP